ncbi:MAG: transposase [Chloroflexi bacterium]|nr:transposase [Chloroflexota bacterium]
MSYEYQKMSPEEQIAVVEHRRARGYPLHAPPHPYRDTGWYLITAANFEHKSIMHSPDRRDEFETRLLGAFLSVDAEIGGSVVLTNHYHILVGVDSLDTVSALLKQLHGTTSREWNLADGMTGQRQVWYKFADRWIRNERHYYQALNYIHYNPVKHGYVDDPYKWAWSSVQLYFDTKGRDWLRATWKEYPVGNFGSGWDD